MARTGVDPKLGEGAVEEPEQVTWSPRLGRRLEGFRKRAHLRRVDLAARLGVSEETVRLWEGGHVQPSADSLTRLIPILAIEASLWEDGETDKDEDVEELPALALRLRKAREEEGLSQAAMAHRIGVAQATYAGWETARSNPGPEHTAAIAEVLGLEEDAVRTMRVATVSADTSGWSELGRVMGARRMELGLSRADLADLLEVSVRAVVNWELGYRRPRPAQVGTLAEALGLEPAVLLATMPARGTSSRLGALILERQRELGLRSADVAAMVGTTESTLSRWVNGHSRPMRQNLERLAEALKLPTTKLTDLAEAHS